MEQSDQMRPAVKNLHAIRGVAALVVVFYHAKFALWVGGKEFLLQFPLTRPADYFLFSLDMLTSCGKQCVIIFFLLSAFVIKYTFQRNKPSIGAFYLTRLLRIYLPYVPLLLLAGALLYVAGHYFHPESFADANREFHQRMLRAYGDLSFLSFGKALLFLPNVEYFGFTAPYWSLLHEGIFYLLFPIYNRLKPVYLSLLFPVYGTAYFLTGSPVFYYQIFFVIGLLLYEYFISNQKKWKVSRGTFWIAGFIFFVMINVALHITPAEVPDIAATIFYFWVVNYLLQQRSVPIILLKIGDMSYTLYLAHLPIMMFVYVLLCAWMPGLELYDRLYYYLGVVVSVACAYPLYVLVEKRSLVVLSSVKHKLGIR